MTDSVIDHNINISKYNSLVGSSYINYQKNQKCFEEKNVDLLIIGKEGKKQYVLLKDFNTLIYNHTLHHGRKHFCHYCLQAFSTDKILRCYVTDCFKINGKQTAMVLCLRFI